MRTYHRVIGILNLVICAADWSMYMFGGSLWLLPIGAFCFAIGMFSIIAGFVTNKEQ